MKDLIEALQIFLKYGNPYYPIEGGWQELYTRGMDCLKRSSHGKLSAHREQID